LHVIKAREKKQREMTSYRSGPRLSGTLMLALYCGGRLDRDRVWMGQNYGPCGINQSGGSKRGWSVTHTQIKRGRGACV